MNPQSPEPPVETELLDTASQWLARRRSGTMSAADELEFLLWRDADPRHAAAFAAVQRTFADIAALHELAQLEPAHRKPALTRPVWIAAGALAAAVAFFVVFSGANQHSAPAERHATPLAQIEQLHLEDGTLVTLGAASTIEVRYTERERRIILTAGQAFFDVGEDPRPLVIEAGDALIRDIGTRFDVNRAEGRVRVSVSEGIVEITEPPSGVLLQRRDPVILRAGVRAEFRDRAEFGARPVAPTLSTAAAPAAWLEGRFVYDDVRLADLVADLNRYYSRGIAIADPSLAEIRLTASFEIEEIDVFLATLPSAAPIELVRARDGSTVLQRKTN